MTTVHANLIGDQAIMPREEFDCLLELARRSEPVAIETADDIPALGLTLLAEQGGAFDFLAEDDDIYSAEDGRVRYR